MRIDWNETLIGAVDTAAEPGTRAAARVLASLRLGRLAGIFASAVLVAIAFMLLPSGTTSTLPFFIAASGLLLANVLGLVAIERLGARGIAAAFIAALSGLMPAATLSIAAAGGMIAILALEWFWQSEARKARSEWLHALAVAAIGAALVTLVLCNFAMLPSLLVGGALVPLLVSTIRLHGLSVIAERERNNEDARNRAFIQLALARLPKTQLLVDSAGRIEPIAADSTFARHLAIEDFAGDDLIERVLIADRPKVLQALSDAIHKNAGPLTVIARLAKKSAEGSLAAPTYIAQRLTLAAAPGIAERAIVLIERAERRARADDKAVVEGPAGTMIEALRPQSPESELLARALHDSVSPFNAGLGYLEMIADPRLAPQEMTSWRHYAREASAAIREAHRNATLMGRWLKLDSLPAHPRPERMSLADLASDMLRALHLAGDGTSLEFRVDDASAALDLAVVPDRARFALGIFLRGLACANAKAGRITLFARYEHDDLRLVAMVEPVVATPKSGDMFQLALERAAQKLANVRFEAGSDGAPSLLFLDVRAADIAPFSAHRLAS